MPEAPSTTAANWRRLIGRLKHHDWLSVVIDFVILVVGIFIGLQANLWVQSRQDQAVERHYLERLLADSNASVLALQQAIEMYDTSAATLASISSSFERGGDMPPRRALSDAMCQWFVQADVQVHRGTYSELLSSGRLSLINDEDLRDDLARQEAAHEEAQGLDNLTPAILEAEAPLAKYRTWKIVTTGAAGINAPIVDCEFDIAGMRRDQSVNSAVAQLYRGEMIHRLLRQRELTAVTGTRSRLRQLLREAP